MFVPTLALVGLKSSLFGNEQLKYYVSQCFGLYFSDTADYSTDLLYTGKIEIRKVSCQGLIRSTHFLRRKVGSGSDYIHDYQGRDTQL